MQDQCKTTTRPSIPFSLIFATFYNFVQKQRTTTTTDQFLRPLYTTLLAVKKVPKLCRTITETKLIIFHLNIFRSQLLLNHLQTKIAKLKRQILSHGRTLYVRKMYEYFNCKLCAKNIHNLHNLEYVLCTLVS